MGHRLQLMLIALALLQSGGYDQSFQAEDTEDDKIKQRSFSGAMHTDGVSMSLRFDVVESEDEEEQSKV
jgi:hypothetical protein